MTLYWYSLCDLGEIAVFCWKCKTHNFSIIADDTSRQVWKSRTESVLSAAIGCLHFMNILCQVNFLWLCILQRYVCLQWTQFHCAGTSVLLNWNFLFCELKNFHASILYINAKLCVENIYLFYPQYEISMLITSANPEQNKKKQIKTKTVQLVCLSFLLFPSPSFTPYLYSPSRFIFSSINDCYQLKGQLFQTKEVQEIKFRQEMMSRRPWSREGDCQILHI